MNYDATIHMTVKEVRAALARRSEFRLLDISGGNSYGYDWAIVRRDEPKHYLLTSSDVKRTDGRYPSVFDRAAVEELFAA